MNRIRNSVFILLFAAVIAASFSPAVRQYVNDRKSVESEAAEGVFNRLLPPPFSDKSESEAGTAQSRDFPPFPSQVNITQETETSQSGATILPTTIEGGMAVSNDTELELDINDLLAAGPSIRLSGTGFQILIVHTHGSEAFSPDSAFGYETSDNCRTEDTNYNVVRVGDEIASCLESYGFGVLHDRGIYDSPSYTGSYARSGAVVERYLEAYPEISIVLDVHRDAIGRGDVVYKTVAEGGGIPSSQLMLLCGTGENGLSHPNWLENFKLALYLQSSIVKKHPTLARPVALKKERYNQQLTFGSLILEVGSSGNTLSEALQAARLFSESVAPALQKLMLD